MKEMMVHHSIMIGGGLTVMLDKVYGNFTLYALTMEVNSIFLHGRALLQMCNKRETAAFKMVSMLNLLVILRRSHAQTNSILLRQMSLTGCRSTMEFIIGPVLMAFFTVKKIIRINASSYRLCDEYYYHVPEPETALHLCLSGPTWIHKSDRKEIGIEDLHIIAK